MPMRGGSRLGRWVADHPDGTSLRDEARSRTCGTRPAAIMLTAIGRVIVFPRFRRRLIGGLGEGALKG